MEEEDCASESTTLDALPENVTPQDSQPRNAFDAMSSVGKKRKDDQRGHRIASESWGILSDNINDARSSKSSKCKHCRTVVKHGGKADRVVKHLQNCEKANDYVKSLPEERITPHLKQNYLGTNGEGGVQRDIKGYGVRGMTQTEKIRFRKLMAMYFYTTGTAFERIENPYLTAALQLLRADVSIPNRKDLSGASLNDAFEAVSLNANKVIQDESYGSTLISDGWSDVNMASIINYLSASTDHTIFIEALTASKINHTGEFLAADIKRVIDSLKSNICGVCTDNTAANKKAWAILKKDHFPQKFFYGCAAHALHLIVKSLFGVKQQADGTWKGDNMVGFPFGTLVELHLNCVDLTKFFKNHHSHRAVLMELQKQAKLRTLPLPGETRWGTISKNFIAVMESERLIHGILTNPTFLREGTLKQRARKEQVRDIISHPELLPRLEKAIELLKNIDMFIVMFQSDKVFLSDVYNCFQVLNGSFESDIFTPEERAWAKKVVAARFDFLCIPAHGLTARLDPRYMHLDTVLVREKHDKLICEMSLDGTPVPEDIQLLRYTELEDLDLHVQRMKSTNGIPWKVMLKPLVNIKKWWSTKGTMWPNLKPIALTLFSLVPSAGSAERNFSTFGFIHSKLRNRLGSETVAKLVFIKQNGGFVNLLHDVTTAGKTADHAAHVMARECSNIDDDDDTAMDIVYLLNSSDDSEDEPSAEEESDVEDM